jgi:hypothetical protein
LCPLAVAGIVNAGKRRFTLTGISDPGYNVTV